MARRIHCGINTDPANEHGRPSVQQIQDLGATWVRFTFKDDTAGPQPTRFAFYDDPVQELSQARIKILMILSYETHPGKPAREADDATWDAYINKFATRCRQIAQHYGSQVQAYQIWNEPDFLAPSPGYDPCVRPQVFGRMLRSAYTAIKEVSAATVVMGGLAAGQPSYLGEVRAGTGGVLYVDAVGVHPYGRRPTEDWPRPDWGFGVLGDLIHGYHNAAGKPIWITEIGTNDTAVQDPFPRRAFEALNANLADAAPSASGTGLAPNVFWFCWSDGMVNPFGVVDAAGGHKGSYTSFREFAALPLEEVGVIDRPSVHSSSRQGETPRYIIVHSTASPVGVPAENTLDYLVGPNDRGVSAHELVLPGPEVYRLVTDERAAHHCESESVSFPDGTPANLANEITWGIEAYQVAGRVVGEEVLAATIERVVVACGRLRLDSSRVLGHREIDPDRRDDPVGVDMDEFRAQVARALLGDALLAEAEARLVIQFNPNAALQSRIFADGFVPNSPEFDVQVHGITYRAQRAEHLGTGQVRVYYAQVGDWANVRFAERA